ncbi:MAG: hypothetical protein H7Y37_19140, partial [Anaerolineae bacterium]|nr:hypothetical protein [Gloeobacterales cyanobacterium ES-bin-313]
MALLTPTLPRNLVIRTAAQDVLQIYRDKPWEMFTGKPLEVFDPLVAKYPKDAEVYEWRGYFRSEVRFNSEPNLQGARDDFTQALRLAPSKPDNYVGRAIVNFDLGQLALAEADYTEALKFGAKAFDLPERLSNQAFFVLLSRAETRWLLGKAKGAAQDYALALKDKTVWEKLWPSDDLWRLFWKRGVCYFASGDLKSALNDLDRAIAMIQTEEMASWLAAMPYLYEELYLERGYLRVALGDEVGALADFRQTVELINKPVIVRGEIQQIPRAIDFGSGRGITWLYSSDLT